MCFDAPVIRSLTRKFRLILLALLRSERFSFNDCLGGTAWVTFQTNTWKINPQNNEVHLRRPFIAASVLTYPVNPAYKICSPERKFFNTLWIRNRVDAKSKYFVIRWRNKIEPSSLPHQIRYFIQESNLIPRFSQGRARSKFRALYDACSIVKSWVLEWIRIHVDGQIRLWIRLDVEIYESGKKSCEFKNIRIRACTGPKCLKNGSDRLRKGHMIRRRILGEQPNSLGDEARMKSP